LGNVGLSFTMPVLAYDRNLMLSYNSITVFKRIPDFSPG
jgi:hypothetical protein